MKKFFPVDDGCVLYLTPRKQSSSVWINMSKYGDNGTVQNATLDRKGYGFNGTTSYVNCGSGARLNIEAAITISAWIKTTLDGTYDSIYSNYSAGSVFWFNISANKHVRLFRSIDIADVAVEGVTPLTANAWNHVVMTYNNVSRVVLLYLNGALDRTGSFSSVYEIQGTTRLIGTYNIIPNHNLTGLIDEVRIYNRALSASEILAHYGKTRKFYGV